MRRYITLLIEYDAFVAQIGANNLKLSKMENLISNNTANNAMEAKIIVDSFLSSLTDKQCADLAFRSIEHDAIYKMPLTISYAIGASSYYYGAECKHFCSDVISNVLFNRGFDYIKAQKETV